MPFIKSQRYVIFNGKKSKNYPLDNKKINNKEVLKNGKRKRRPCT